MAIAIGSKAPDFVLKTKNANGLQDVRLSDNFGKSNTVLIFVPLAFTSVCTKELCDITSNLNSYTSLKAVVYGISVDSPFAQEAWAEKEGYGFTLLSDFNREVSAAYDVLFKEVIGFKGIAKRSAFVVNKQGVVVYAESSDDLGKLPDFDKIQAALKANP